MGIIPAYVWKQDLNGFNFAGWFVKRNVAVPCSLISGVIQVLLGALYLLLMQGAWETEPVSVNLALEPQTISIPENADSVALYVDIPKFYSNYRSFTSSKDPMIASAAWVKIKCGDDGEKKKDFDFVRFGNLSANPNKTWLENHPLINPDGLNASMPRPCGLNSFALLLDMFKLNDPNGTAVELDETRVAWGTDVDFVKSKLDIKGIFNDSSDSDGKIRFESKGDTTVSWLRGNNASTQAHEKDRAFLRLLSFYRTSAGRDNRLLLGHYDGLTAGNYTLQTTHLDKSWNEWGEGTKDRKVLLAKLSPVGSNNAFIPIACIVVGSFQLFIALVLTCVKPKMQ